MTILTRTLAGLLALTAAALALPAHQEPGAGAYPNARFGRPVTAWAEPGDREAHLLKRPQYTLSYNGKTRTPNWVAWRLVKADMGRASRGPFQPDPLLPGGFARVTSGVYNGSGFDRGHQCPAADRSARQEDCDATFLMTNIVPQAPDLNQKTWERLESYCRTLAREGHELQIVCGPHGAGGTGKEGRRDEIGRGRLTVTVPKHCWKVVLVLPREGAEPRKNSRVISVVMPNEQGLDLNWAHYRVPAKAVEKLTGLKFFSALPAELQAALKEPADDVTVREPRPRERP